MKRESLQRIRWRPAGGILAAVVLLGLGHGMEGPLRRVEPSRVDGWLGIRSVAADFAWIAVQAAWERQDQAGTTAAIRRAVTWDPDRSYFWINGARMMAYDLAAWRTAQAGGPEAVPDALEQRWREEQARQALAHLEAGRARHPGDFNFPIEQGNIELWARGNVAGAAEAFGRASSLPGAPEYALRLEVGLLRRIGRTAEALRRLERYVSVSDPESSHSPQDGWVGRTMHELRRELETTNKE